VPPVFAFLEKHGSISDKEVKRVFSLCIGYCVIVRKAFAESIKEQLEKLGKSVFVIGEVVKGRGLVRDRA